MQASPKIAETILGRKTKNKYLASMNLIDKRKSPILMNIPPIKNKSLSFFMQHFFHATFVTDLRKQIAFYIYAISHFRYCFTYKQSVAHYCRIYKSFLYLSITTITGRSSTSNLRIASVPKSS